MLEKLVGLLDKVSLDRMGAGTVKKTKLAILNYIAGSLPGADAKVTMAEMNMWASLGSSGGKCTILGKRGNYGVLEAAAVNGTMGQVIFQEDCHEKSISHPGVIVIPTALALGQHQDISGRCLMEAVVGGYEIQGRIGRGLILPGFPKNGLRPASVVGPFGSAAAAGLILGLSHEQIADALSIVANTVSGVMEFSISGTEDICIQNCYSVKNGLMAAFEAKAGIGGASTILDGRFGLACALNGGLAFDKSVLNNPDSYEIDDTFIKMYPCCGHVLPTAQAIAEIMASQRIQTHEVDSIRIGTREVGKLFPGCDNPGPFEGIVSAMMSHQFAAASAIVKGAFDVNAVQDCTNLEIYALARKSLVYIDEDVSALPAHRAGGKVEVILKDGTSITSFQNETIPLSSEGVLKRMRENGRRFYSSQQIESVIEKIMNLESVKNINEIMSLLELK